MWKLIILSTFIIASHATSIQNFYGEWVPAAFYPIATYVPICLHYSFSEYPEDVQCTCSDGKNTTIVQVQLIENGEPVHREPLQMRVVDTPGEVMPSLNVTCRCADREFKYRVVARRVNENYFVMYENIPPGLEDTRTEKEPNVAYLLTKSIPSQSELVNIMSSIEDLSERRGAIMCTEEYSEELKRQEK